MSNYLAVATVTAALAGVLEPPIHAQPGWSGVQVTAVRPDTLENDTTTPRVNIFLYQATPDPYRRNDDLPTRRASGEVVQRPTAALDLHYLFSFYGNETQLEPQRLLGIVTRTLHTQPLLTQQNITAAIGANTFLAGSNLDASVDAVRFTPAALSLEELSKLWSTFFRTHYILSAAYQASVVLIESEDMPQTAPPVRQRNLYVVPMRQPLVERIVPQVSGPPLIPDAGLDQPILPDSILLIGGQRLRGENGTQVRIFGAAVPIAAADLADTQITLALTALPAGTRIRAGAQGLQVIHPIPVGSPPTAHPGIQFESNAAPFVLHPPAPSTAFPPVVNGVKTMTTDVSPVVVGTTQRGVLTLYATSGGVASGPSYTLVAQPLAAEGSVLTFVTNDIPPGPYILTVQIDGASSLLTVNGAGVYDGPTVVIP